MDRTPKSSESHLIFGGYDSSKIDGDINWHDVK